VTPRLTIATPRVGKLLTLWLAEFSFKHSKADSPTRWVRESATPRLAESESQQLPDSPSQRVADSQTPRVRESLTRRLVSWGVVFWLRISPQIQSQNWNGSKGSIRDLRGTNFCKTPENPPHCHVPLSWWNKYILFYSILFSLTLLVSRPMLPEEFWRWRDGKKQICISIN
jgi:hypothetical protein